VDPLEYLAAASPFGAWQSHYHRAASKDQEGNFMNARRETVGPKVLTMRRLARMIVTLSLVFVCACAAPIGVKPISPRAAQRALTENILSTGELSPKAHILLRRSSFEQLWKENPAAVETRAGYLEAVAELCFAHASRTDDPRYYLAAALYAWVYLFPPGGEFGPAVLDRGNRLAADLYNRGITLGFTDPETGEVVLRDGEYALPFRVRTSFRNAVRRPR
jgi:hypothetical protein